MAEKDRVAQVAVQAPCVRSDKGVLTEQERRKLIRAGRKLGSQLRDLISIVAYDTFRRWVREADGQRKSRKKAKPKSVGRPRTEAEIRELVIQIRQETGYGYSKLLGELRKLGIKVSRQTIARILGDAARRTSEIVLAKSSVTPLSGAAQVHTSALAVRSESAASLFRPVARRLDTSPTHLPAGQSPLTD